MSSKRIFFVMVAIVSLLGCMVVASVVIGNNMLGKQAAELQNLRLEDRVIEEQQTALIAATKELEQYSDLEKIARAIVPQDKDQARTVREINNIAQQSGVKLKSIDFPVSNLGQAAPRSSSAEDEQNGDAQSPTSSPLTQVKPVEGIPGVFSLALSITPDSGQPLSYYQLLGFLEKLETNRRTAHVDKISITPAVGGNSFSFVLTLNVYVKP